MQPAAVSLAKLPGELAHAARGLALEPGAELVARVVATDGGGAGAGARRAGGVLLVDQVAEADPDALVARGVDVGDVVRQSVEPRLLSRHSCGGGVKPFEHWSPLRSPTPA